MKQHDFHRAIPMMTWDSAKTFPTPRRAMLALRHMTAAGIPPVAPLAALTFGAFLVRAMLVTTQSAYMDEASMILTGRLLIEKHTSYFNALNWSYGSYLWPLIAAAADIIGGGLTAVRLVTAAFGALMVLGTALFAYHIAPAHLTQPQRLSVALLSGAVMALFPTPIGVGRFSTYDAPAAAGLMLSIALLAGVRRTGRKTWLLAAAALIFFAFLSKYVVAIYLPPVCLYLLLSARSVRTLVRNLLCFIVPLSAAVAAYFLVFRKEMYALLDQSKAYTDLKSPTPMREYVTQRPELFVLAAIALLAWRKVGRAERLICFGGLAIIALFQVASRPDYDWWKHSIYPIFFLAPLAAIAAAPLVSGTAEAAAIWWRRSSGAWRAFVLLTVAIFVPLAGHALMRGMVRVTAASDFARIKRTASLVALGLAVLILLLMPLIDILRERRGLAWRISWRAICVALVLGVLLPVATAKSQTHADDLVTFYPDLSQAVPGIRAETAGARLVLADDSAVRYYLYAQTPPDKIIDPFGFNYHGLSDVDAYRRAITDRAFDAIVLDGGIGPFGQRIRKELSGVIAENYDRVYSITERHGIPIDVYHARTAVAESNRPIPPGATVYRFDSGTSGWSIHNESGALKPGFGVTTTTDQQWSNLPVLKFSPTDTSPLISTGYQGHASQVRAQIYVVGLNPVATQVQIGMVGFDTNWGWHDDGFKNDVTTGRWVEIVWNVTNVGAFNEIGLQVNPGTVQTLYIGRVEIDP